jgi:zinc protease
MPISRRRLLQFVSMPSALPWAAHSVEAVGLPPMPLHQRRLANGLQLIALSDASSASVAVQVWYFVGAKDDPPGRSGFAHLFEHLMFKRTRYMQAEMFDRLTEDVGGHNNAFTAEDVTAYLNVVPANHLERLLWAEAERMAHLDVDQASFESERKVVEEEFRQSVLSAPYGRLFNALPEHGFTGAAYRRPVIGDIAQLDQATLADVRRFHTTFYRPDNALLLVSGGFDVAQLDAWVDRYFGAVAAPAAPIPQVRVD